MTTWRHHVHFCHLRPAVSLEVLVEMYCRLFPAHSAIRCAGDGFRTGLHVVNWRDRGVWARDGFPLWPLQPQHA